jgi:hypothetical protein
MASNATDEESLTNLPPPTENTAPPIDDLVWNNITAFTQATASTPRSQTSAANNTTMIPPPSDNTRQQGFSDQATSPDSDSKYYEAILPDLPQYSSMSKILDDFIHVHHERDV